MNYHTCRREILLPRRPSRFWTRLPPKDHVFFSCDEVVVEITKHLNIHPVRTVFLMFRFLKMGGLSVGFLKKYMKNGVEITTIVHPSIKKCLALGGVPKRPGVPPLHLGGFCSQLARSSWKIWSVPYTCGSPRSFGPTLVPAVFFNKKQGKVETFQQKVSC